MNIYTKKLKQITCRVFVELNNWIKKKNFQHKNFQKECFSLILNNKLNLKITAS